jgi:hypothetical protein
MDCILSCFCAWYLDPKTRELKAGWESSVYFDCNLEDLVVITYIVHAPATRIIEKTLIVTCSRVGFEFLTAVIMKSTILWNAV